MHFTFMQSTLDIEYRSKLVEAGTSIASFALFAVVFAFFHIKFSLHLSYLFISFFRVFSLLVLSLNFFSFY